jgi:hypothetical protein
MSSTELPQYVLLWIIDYLPNYDMLSHLEKIRLIESCRDSIWKIKGEKAKRKGLCMFVDFSSKLEQREERRVSEK